MKKGIDYPGVCVTFYCHDGKGNYLFHKRSEACKDERGRWDCGGGSIEHGEHLIDAVKREVKEEYGTEPLEIEFLGFSEVFRVHEGTPTHWLAFRYRVLVDRDKVINGEPEKHAELGWYTIDNIPSPPHSQIPEELEKYKEFLV